jgi:L-fuculose-phosphate aldolase
MPTAAEIRRAIVKVCHELDRRQYVGGRDGNVSARLPDGDVVVTPAGMRKGDVELEDLVVVDRRGRAVGKGRASSELGMHLRIYELRADVGAVVHAHPPVATGFAAAGVGLQGCVLPEVIVGLGRVPVAPYATPGTPDLSRALDDLVPEHDAILLENHGVVCVGEDLDGAHGRLETVEQAARILLVARLLGGAHPLRAEQVAELLSARGRYGVREGLAACDVDSGPPAGRALGPEEEALAERVAARVRERLATPRPSRG